MIYNFLKSSTIAAAKAEKAAVLNHDHAIKIGFKKISERDQVAIGELIIKLSKELGISATAIERYYAGHSNIGNQTKNILLRQLENWLGKKLLPDNSQDAEQAQKQSPEELLGDWLVDDNQSNANLSSSSSSNLRLG